MRRSVRIPPVIPTGDARLLGQRAVGAGAQPQHDQVGGQRARRGRHRADVPGFHGEALDALAQVHRHANLA
jgi:hypothetical protein